MYNVEKVTENIVDDDNNYKHWRVRDIFIPRSSVEMITLKIMLIITVIISGVAHGRGRTGASFPLQLPLTPMVVGGVSLRDTVKLQRT